MDEIGELVFTASKGSSPSLLLSIDEAAAKISIKRSTFIKMLNSGEIQSIKIGKLRRIPVHCLQNWLDHKMQEHGIQDCIPRIEHGEKDKTS